MAHLRSQKAMNLLIRTDCMNALISARCSTCDEIAIPSGWLVCTVAASLNLIPSRFAELGILSAMLAHSRCADRCKEETAWALATLAGKTDYALMLVARSDVVTFLLQLVNHGVKRSCCTQVRYPQTCAHKIVLLGSLEAPKPLLRRYGRWPISPRMPSVPPLLLLPVHLARFAANSTMTVTQSNNKRPVASPIYSRSGLAARSSETSWST